MKTINKLFSIATLAFLCCFTTQLRAKQNDSLIAPYSFSISSEYKRNHFEGLTQEEKTEKFQKIFSNQLNFVKTNKIRRLIVKILDPIFFNFFHPENFTSERDDNFFYWASQLANVVEIEVLFDSSSFQLCKESLFDRLAGYYRNLRDYFIKQKKPFGNFQNIIEKMEWVAWTNEIYADEGRSHLLIVGVTLDPVGIGDNEIYYQNLLNAFDQFRFQTLPKSNVPNWIPENSIPGLRIAMFLPLDMKDFALANASSFPLSSHLRYNQVGNIGINLPQNFPSTAPDFPTPYWRGGVVSAPILDTVYLQMNDPRLIPCIYQNYDILPKPDQSFVNDPATKEKMPLLGTYLENCFRGIPFVKGPGYITNQQGSSDISGYYTFFQTGSPSGKGQFISGQTIEIRPPYVTAAVTRTVIGAPETNRKMKLNSTLSTTHPMESVEYWHTPIPCNWSYPQMSSTTRERIYYVFSTDYEPNGFHYFGNWHGRNLMSLLGFYHHFGFIKIKPFTDMNNKPVTVNNNIVLSDYSTIPNGDLFPQCNWELGNQNY